jgi:hypothetical protein
MSTLSLVTLYNLHCLSLLATALSKWPAVHDLWLERISCSVCWTCKILHSLLIIFALFFSQFLHLVGSYFLHGALNTVIKHESPSNDTLLNYVFL